MQFSNKWLKIYRLLVCVLITSFFILHIADLKPYPTLQRMENILYDLRLRTTLANTVDPRIVIVDIDESSLAQEGRWPWSRDKISYLVDILFDYYHVKLLGFDMVFSEPDRSSGLGLLEKLATGTMQGDAKFLAALKTLRPQLAYDDLFAKSLRNRPVVLGFSTSPNVEKIPQIGALPPPLTTTDNLPFTSSLFNEKSYTANLEQLQNAAASGGFFSNPSVDADGVYRKLPLLIRYDNHLYEALSLAMIRVSLESPAIEFITGQYGLNQAKEKLEGLRMDVFTIPVDKYSNIRVPFRGRKGSFPYVSAADVLNGITDKAILENKIIIVGTTAPGLNDSRATPVQNVYQGVEIHANILSGFLDQSIKSRPDFILAAEIAELILICLLAVFVFPRLSVIFSAIVFGFLLAGLIAANFYCWTVQNIDMILAIPLMLLSVLYSTQLFFGYFFETRRKKQLGRVFGQYIPPELVEQMSQSDEEFSLKGESREMTVLFSDVRGFTTISETMEPDALCELINAILTPVTSVIHDYKGTIDKYIGDAIMAFWGAPMRNPNHATLAVQSGLAILQTLAMIQTEFKARGWPEIDIGIGLNTGTMSVGNMGSQFRIAYTVMGDAVNLGSRLEGLTKQYGVKIIVSETTMQAAPDFIYRELDKVRVKGKHKPITIYEPLGTKAEISKEQAQAITALDQGLLCYRHQHWEAALTIFKHLSEHYPDDKLYAVYLERIAYYQLSPPEPDWDGAFTHSSK